MNPPVLIAIDGGGSKARAVLARGHRLLARVEMRGLNPRDISSAEFDVRLRSLLSPLVLSGLGPVPTAGVYVCAALAGAGEPEVRRSCRRSIGGVLKEYGGCRRLRVVTDVAALVEARLGKRDGIVLIAGTGSVCLGVKHARGRRRVVKAGGLGGRRDQGCGFSIGARLVERERAARNPRRLGRSGTASLAPLVLAAYSAGDGFARRVVEEAVADLVRMVVAVESRAGLGARTGIYFSGGLFENDAFRSLFRRRLAEVVPNAAPEPAGEVLTAALELARRSARR
jgi:N-acetylglucosamine kinase-like BadF-type ATPase